VSNASLRTALPAMARTGRGAVVRCLWRSFATFRVAETELPSVAGIAAEISATRDSMFANTGVL